jgi:hypothetical protein
MADSFKAFIAAAAVIAMLAAPVRAHAWGFEAHAFIMARAIALLPAELRPFFEANRTFLIEHTIDPDLWRTAGFTEEPPRHFIDIDAYGAYPFKELPRDYAAALKKYGAETLRKNGLLPWRTAEVAEWLRRAFAQLPKGSAYASNDVKFFSTVLAHYVADGHVPFHAVTNYDGQLTGQNGIHLRWEGELFTRYQQTLSIKPAPIRPIPNMRNFMFDTALTSFQLTQSVLDADRAAIGTRDEYDDKYFDAFFTGTRPVLERRLGESITAVASAIVSAWEQTGRPAVPVMPPKRVERRRAR